MTCEFPIIIVVTGIVNLYKISPAEEGLATQFSVGRNYGSGVHTNQDYFFTLLSCLVVNPDNVDEVMYCFCYPEYKVAIPMKSTDLIVFNPMKMHCYLNCKYTDSYIFSAYVSEKTVLTAGVGLSKGTAFNDSYIFITLSP